MQGAHVCFGLSVDLCVCVPVCNPQPVYIQLCMTLGEMLWMLVCAHTHGLSLCSGTDGYMFQQVWCIQHIEGNIGGHNIQQIGLERYLVGVNVVDFVENCQTTKYKTPVVVNCVVVLTTDGYMFHGSHSQRM